MIESMTGFGSAVKRSEHFEVTVELRSLNSKFLELILKLPRSYSLYEGPVRNLLASRLLRGKINASITVEATSTATQTLFINKPLAAQYLKELQDLAVELGIAPDIRMEFLLGLPEVIPTDAGESNPETWGLIESAIKEACDRMSDNRREEGKALDDDLARSCNNISQRLKEITELAPVRIQSIRDRLTQSFEEFRNKLGEADRNRFEQELLYYMEKVDINEEIVRLTQHVTYFNQVRQSPESTGKQLNFISQEMGREINTIGSKANHAQIQRLVIQMKDDLEKIKEQVLNIV